MITVKQHEKLIDRIKSLSELELTSFMEDFAVHIRGNNLTHLIDNSFNLRDQDDEIEDLEHDLEKMERDLEKMEREKEDAEEKLSEIENLCYVAMDVEEFEEDAFAQVQKIVQQIKDKV